MSNNQFVTGLSFAVGYACPSLRSFDVDNRILDVFMEAGNVLAFWNLEEYYE